MLSLLILGVSSSSSGETALLEVIKENVLPRSSGSRARPGSSGIHGVRRSISQIHMLNIPCSLPHKGQTIFSTWYSRVSSHLLPLLEPLPRIPPLVLGQWCCLSPADRAAAQKFERDKVYPGNLISQKDILGILEFS